MVDTTCRSYLLYSLSMDQRTSVMELNGQAKWNSIDKLKDAQSNSAHMLKKTGQSRAQELTAAKSSDSPSSVDTPNSPDAPELPD